MASKATEAVDALSGTTKPIYPNAEYCKDGTVVIGAHDKFEVTIPKLPGQKTQPDVYVDVNDKNALIQRGAPVTVERPLFDAIQESFVRRQKADDFYYANASEK